METDNGAILYSELFKDDGGLDKLITVLQQINTAYDNLHANVKGKAIELKASTEGLSGATALQREEITKLLNESQKLKDVESQLTKLKSDYAAMCKKAQQIQAEELAMNQKAIDIYKQVVGAETNLNLTKNELNTIRRNAINYMGQEKDSYAQLAAKANLITLALNKMTVEQRTNSEQGKLLTAQAKEYTEILKVQDAAVGRHQRNVGDYGKATAKLNFATAQIVRELPAAAMRADMFFLAISNNIPMLADQVNNIKEMNKELIKNGKAMEVVSVPKALLKSFLSWNTLMMVGVTLLTMYGGKIVEWIGTLFKGKEKLNEFGQTVKQVNEENAKSIEEISKSSSKNIASFKILSEEWSKLGNNLNDKKKFIEDNKKAFDELGVSVENVQDAENLFVKNSNAFIKAEETKARVLYYRGKVQDLVAKQEAISEAKRLEYERIRKQTGVDFSNMKYVNAANAYFASVADGSLNLETQLNDTISKISALQNKISDIYKGAGIKEAESNNKQKKERTKQEKDYSKEALDSQTKLNEDLAKNQEDSLNKQLEINRTAIEKEILEANAKANEAIDILDQESKGKIKLTEKQKDDLEKIANNLTDDQKAIIEKGAIEQQKIRDDFNKKSIDQLNKYTEDHWKETQDAANKELDADLLAIDDKYNIDVKAAQETIKNRRDLNIKLLQLELEMLEAKKKLNNPDNPVYDVKLNVDLDKAINDTERQLEKLTTGKGSGLKGYLAKILGVTDDQMEIIMNNLSTAIDSIKSSLSDLLQAYIDFYDAKIDKQQENVDQAQKLVDTEREAKANGYASNVSAAEASLSTEQAALEKSQAEKEKYVKLQQDLDAAMQLSSLITATANILASYSKIPFIGQVLAIAGIAGMWGTFIAAKATAAQVTKYGEGGYGVLEGGSHASGNDILLGTTKDGTQLRAEGDEGYGVINRRMTRKYAKILPDIFKSINNGIFEQKYLASYKGQEMNIINANYTDTSRMEKGINKLISQNEVKTFIDGKGRTVIIKGNTTRIIS